ncbi:MAG: COP23 domain-containing protein [Scytonematopsis contorta HA4267-MV1]|jgi:hypothetical protein|nr:COP23 domain-containing protein [Scytonematopsis contorta HA4267-MV1]
MSLRTLKLVLLSSLGLSLFLGNSIALAQYDSSDGVVVPTTGGSNSGSNGGINIPRPIGGNGTTTTSVDGNARFSCQLYNGQPTVMYQPQSQPGQYFAWASPRALGGGWDSQRRCETIAQRLESYRSNGLSELQTAVENRQNIICATTQSNNFCRIVLTVPPERDPVEVRDQVFANLSSADDGQDTIPVNTYGNRTNSVDEIRRIGDTLFGGGRKPAASNSRKGINLKPFLDRADGGDGTKMRGGVALRRTPVRSTQNNTRPARGLRLNTDRLR